MANETDPRSTAEILEALYSGQWTVTIDAHAWDQTTAPCGYYPLMSGGFCGLPPGHAGPHGQPQATGVFVASAHDNHRDGAKRLADAMKRAAVKPDRPEVAFDASAYAPPPTTAELTREQARWAKSVAEKMAYAIAAKTRAEYGTLIAGKRYDEDGSPVAQGYERKKPETYNSKSIGLRIRCAAGSCDGNDATVFYGVPRAAGGDVVRCNVCGTYWTRAEIDEAEYDRRHG